MDLKELNILNKLSFGILSLTGSLVAILGLVLWANLSSSNPYLEAAAQPMVVSNRAPASLPDVTSAVSKVQETPALSNLKKEIRTYDLDCNGRLAQAKEAVTVVTVEQIRLRKPKCGNEVTSTEIVNASNGYVASVFQTNQDQMSTDYINLAEGENRIKVLFRDRLGAPHTSELWFSRSSAQ